MRGSIVKREGKAGSLYYVVVQNRWHKVPDPQTKRNAEIFQAQLVTEIQRGEYVEPQRFTLAEFADRWREVRYPEWSPNTQHGYDTCLKNYILPRLGNRQVPAITSEDIQAWKAAMLKKYAPATVALAQACLSLLFASAVEWKYLRVNPVVGVKRPKKRRKEVHPLTPEQLRQLLRATDDLQWRALICMTATGGLRIGEVAAARWKYLDLDTRTYFVRETLVQRAGVKEIRPPKSKESETKVRLSPACCAALEAHRSAQAEGALKSASYQDQGLIFAKPDGRIWEARLLHRAWSGLLVDAGLPHFRFHDLRHTCATLLIDQGAHPKVVQEQLRHVSIITTLDTYGHLFPQRVDDAVARMDEAFGMTVGGVG